MTIFCDGFHNKKETGFTIVDDSDNVLSHVKLARETSNGAELWGIYKAVALSENGGTVMTDSQVCCAWLRKGRAEARPDLDSLIQTISEMKRNKLVRVVWGPRGTNRAGLWNEKHAG